MFNFEKPLEPKYQANILVTLTYGKNGLIGAVKASKDDTLQPVLDRKEINDAIKKWVKEKNGFGITTRLTEGFAKYVSETFYENPSIAILEESHVEGDKGYAKVNIRRY